MELATINLEDYTVSIFYFKNIGEKAKESESLASHIDSAVSVQGLRVKVPKKRLNYSV